LEINSLTLARRGFLAAGGAIAGSGLLHSAAAKAAAGGQARSVAEFGVEPGSDADQSAALQEAIDRISASGETVHLPGGTYRSSAIRLPSICALTGVPGHTRLLADGKDALFQAADAASIYLAGLAFEGGAISGSAGEVTIEAVQIRNAPDTGIALGGVKSLFVSQCRFEKCAGAAIDIATERAAANTATISNNHIAFCKTGIALKGNGQVTGNTVSGASEFGLRLGGGFDGGVISATGNIVSDCAIGIGVAANEETLLVSLNLIDNMTRSAAAAIRAFHGDELVGPDLALESSEAYLNLTVVGNVAR
jgi:hypothetical protein